MVQNDQCWGYTTRNNPCKLKIVPPERFCGKCVGSSNHKKAYLSYSLHRMNDKETAQYLDKCTDSELWRMIWKRNLPANAEHCLAKHKQLPVRLYFAEHGLHMGTEASMILAQDDNPKVRAALARNYHIPSEAALFLASDPSVHVRITLANQWVLDNDARSKLMTDPHPKVASIATTRCCHDLSDQEWEQVSKSKYPSVRGSVIGNRNAPVDLRERLAGDAGAIELSRGLAGGRPKTLTAAIAQRLAELGPSARTERTVSRLLKEEQHYGHLEKKELQSLINAFSDTEDKDIWQRVVKLKNASVSLLTQAVQDGKFYNAGEAMKDVLASKKLTGSVMEAITLYRPRCLNALKHIAEHPSASAKALEILAQSKNASVRRNVANNLNTPQDVLRRFAICTEPELVKAVAGNPNASAKTLDLLLTRVPINPSTRNRWESDHVNVLCKAARHPNVAEETLEYLLGDSRSEVLYYIATNTKAPEGILVFLALEQDQSIARTAAKSLAQQKRNAPKAAA